MNKNSSKLIDVAKFDLLDFASRWQRARIASIKLALQEKNIDPASLSVDGSDLATFEHKLLKLTSADDKELVLRKVFDGSRQFGLSAVKYLGLTFETSDLADILPSLGTPCFDGPWRAHNSAFVLSRSGCASLSALGSFGCDYWREALDGLVMGVGDSERLARHQSVGHGDAQCVDVLFSEEYALPRIVSALTTESAALPQKFGPIPNDMSAGLELIRNRFESMKVKLRLEGVSEGVLYYQLEAEEGVLCGAGGKLMHDSFSSQVLQHFPSLILRDTAPIAVYGGST